MAERPNHLHVRAVGEHINLIKPQKHKVDRESLRLFMRKRGENSIRKWKMISRLQFIEFTLNYLSSYLRTSGERGNESVPPLTILDSITKYLI